MTPLSPRHVPPLALAALASLALAACGSSGSGGSSSGSGGGDQLAFARCMRAHGVNVADPKPGVNGGGMLVQQTMGKSGSGLSKTDISGAMAACRNKAGAPKPPTPQEQAEAEAHGLKLARCLRAHGMDVPDPKGGRFMLRADRSPASQRALKACGAPGMPANAASAPAAP